MRARTAPALPEIAWNMRRSCPALTRASFSRLPVNDAFLPHQLHLAQRFDVMGRVTLNANQVGEKTLLDGAQTIASRRRVLAATAVAALNFSGLHPIVDQ